MYVCLCKGISERELREAACRGVSTLRDACRELGVGSECGQCTQLAHEVIINAHQTQQLIQVA